MLAGGLGLFLLAVNMITDGLRLAAGNALRDMLGKWTRSPGRGIASGVSITAIVQSSSAVTAGDSRRAPLGMALAGFGLFFIGIDVLREAFEALAAAIDLQRFTMDGIAGLLLYVAIGFLMTALTQSSSAAIAITLTAATGGILGLYAAAAMVIGANVGTTTTAGFAVIGATPNAKRVAAAHVVFNMATALVALLILPLLFWVVQTTGKLLGLEDIPAVTLALFHTTFNVLGMLLMWPVSGRLTHFLEKRFVTLEEIEGRPQYLDKTVAVSPMLALNALALELSRIAAVARRMALAALSAESGPGKRIRSDHMVAEKLASAVAEFITQLGKSSLSGEVAEQLAKVLRAEQHLLACADQALDVARAQAELGVVDDVDLMEGIGHYRSEVVSLMGLCNPAAEGFSFADCEAQLEQAQVAYDDVKAVLLRAGAELRTPIPGMIDIVEQNSRIRRMARQMVKAMHYLSELYSVTEVQIPESATAVVQQDNV